MISLFEFKIKQDIVGWNFETSANSIQWIKQNINEKKTNSQTARNDNYQIVKFQYNNSGKEDENEIFMHNDNKMNRQS